jgi:hypothetical protein
MRVLALVGLAAVSIAAQEIPSALAALVASAGLTEPVVTWCRAEFIPGLGGGFAAAMESAVGGGRYVALDSDGRVTELGSFKDRPDLSCYTRARADALAVAISQSEGIHGHLTPRSNTTVVCGFIDATAAECWQYSPADRAFVKVGQWVT